MTGLVESTSMPGQTEAARFAPGSILDVKVPWRESDKIRVSPIQASYYLQSAASWHRIQPTSSVSYSLE